MTKTKGHPVTENWPTMEQVESAPLLDLLSWNQHLAAPEAGTPQEAVLTAIVARLRGVQAEVASVEDGELPHADHPGWPA